MSPQEPRTDGTDRLARWVRDHSRAVHGFLLALVRDRHLAEDLLQEVFCRAWQARDRYTESGSERGYLLRIADRLAHDQFRKRGRETTTNDEVWQQIEPSLDDDRPLDHLTAAESQQQLTAALDALTEPQRRTLLLRYYGNLEFSQIAGQLGCPLGTALSHGRRGLLALRRLLVEKFS
jgi:RNA polymerase sigma factor (sigma-70 family)